MLEKGGSHFMLPTFIGSACSRHMNEEVEARENNLLPFTDYCIPFVSRLLLEDC